MELLNCQSILPANAFHHAQRSSFKRVLVLSVSAVNHFNGGVYGFTGSSFGMALATGLFLHTVSYDTMIPPPTHSSTEVRVKTNNGPIYKWRST